MSNTENNIVFLTEDQYKNFDLEHSEKIIKVTHFSKTWAKDSKNNILFSQIAIPALGDFCYEIWLDDNQSVQNFIEDGVEFSVTKDKTYLRIEMHESDNHDLEQVSYDVYTKLFALAASKNLGNLVRVWNYIPNILSEDGDLERYRKFNIGRWNAWEQFGPKFSNGVPIRPAMTGIGALSGPLVIEALFSHSNVIHLESPRQTEFVNYSKKWGPKPPISARGTLLLNADNAELYISGTASLVGEEVAHEGDVIEQTRETLKNIEILIGNENLKRYDQDINFTLDNVHAIRVYVKNPTDYVQVKQILDEVWKDKNILYVNDDICRPGFLIEIEGIAKK